MRNVGGLWLQEYEKNGEKKKFMSGTIEIDGVKHKITVFRNDFKTSDNKQPDYNIFPGKEQEKKEQAACEDIPF